MTGVGDPPLGTPVTPDLHAMTTGTDLDSVALDPDLITTDIGITANMNTAGIIPNHSIDLPTAVPYVIGAPVYTATTETHPTTDLHPTGIPPKMTAGCDIAPGDINTNQPRDLHQHHRHHLGNMGTKDINRLPSMTHPQNITAQMKVKTTPRMI